MKPEKIEPFVAHYKDRRGIVVTTLGIDTANQRVIYRRPGYEHDCVISRREWGNKFTRVKNDER